MTCCRKETCHYLNQCWTSYMASLGHNELPWMFLFRWSFREFSIEVEFEEYDDEQKCADHFCKSQSIHFLEYFQVPKTRKVRRMNIVSECSRSWNSLNKISRPWNILGKNKWSRNNSVVWAINKAISIAFKYVCTDIFLLLQMFNYLTWILTVNIHKRLQ